MAILAIDVGTSSIRAGVVHHDGHLAEVFREPFPPQRPSAGIVEFDALELAAKVEVVAKGALEATGPVEGVGLATQRASTVLWERRSGTPVAPAIGWQDLRTVGECIGLQQRGLRLSPNQSATKLAYLLRGASDYDPADLCFGTIESFLAWKLTDGERHVSDTTNAAVTGLLDPLGHSWSSAVLQVLEIPEVILPELVPNVAVIGQAVTLSGTPLLAALVGDQQASLLGQGCLEPGSAKATLGTGGMLDCCVGAERPAFPVRGEAGTFPIVARNEGDRLSWGVEAIALAAGSCLAWLVSLGLLKEVSESDGLAASVRDSGGVTFVPALEGIATPLWDFGARGTLIGLTGSTSRAEIVRSVLEGIAHTVADLLDAVEADTGLSVTALAVDGGMSTNQTFLQLLADTVARPVIPAAVPESTLLGAAFLAGVSTGTWSSLEEATATVRQSRMVEPQRRSNRERWLDSRERARRTVPAMSAISF